MQKAINEGRGSPEGGVWLDFLDTDFKEMLAQENSSFARMWKLTHEWYLKRGVDLYKEKVQIACSAHAINGGILIDGNAQSSLPGLYAAGEVAAGPHGADRLGGNMSVTCQVFGARAGRHAGERAVAAKHVSAQNVSSRIADALGKWPKQGTSTTGDIKQAIQKAANRNLLVIRTGDGLNQMAEECMELRKRLHEDVAVTTAVDLRAAIELDNMLDVSLMITKAAKLRTESRGSHYREDFPNKDKAQEQSIILDKNVSDGFVRRSLAHR